MLSAIAFILTEIGRYGYRPIIYDSGANDLGFADTMGNHLGAVGLIFFILFIMHANRSESIIVLCFVTFGYVAYELFQKLLPGSTADLKDAVASLIGGLVA